MGNYSTSYDPSGTLGMYGISGPVGVQGQIGWTDGNSGYQWVQPEYYTYGNYTNPNNGYITHTGSVGRKSLDYAVREYIYQWDIMKKPTPILNKNIRVL